MSQPYFTKRNGFFIGREIEGINSWSGAKSIHEIIRISRTCGLLTCITMSITGIPYSTQNEITFVKKDFVGEKPTVRLKLDPIDILLDETVARKK